MARSGHRNIDIKAFFINPILLMMWNTFNNIIKNIQLDFSVSVSEKTYFEYWTKLAKLNFSYLIIERYLSHLTKKRCYFKTNFNAFFNEFKKAYLKKLRYTNFISIERDNSL